MNVASLNQVGGHIASVAARQRHPLVLLWRMLGLRWWQQAFLVVMLALKNMADWAWPVAVAAGIALLEKPGVYPVFLPVLLVSVVVGLYVLNIPVHLWYMIRVSKVVRGFECGLRASLVDHLHRLPQAWHEQRATGSIYSRVMRDVDQVSGLVSHCYHGLLHGVMVAVVAVAVTGYAQPLLLACYLVMAPLAWILARFFERRLRSGNERFRRVTEAAAGQIGDALRMLPYARMHGAEAFQQQRCERSLAGVWRRGIGLDRLTAVFDSVTWVCFQLSHIALLVVAGAMCWRGHISVAEVVLYHGLFAAMTSSLYDLLYNMPRLQQGYASLGAVSEVLSAPCQGDGGTSLPPVQRGEVQLESVRFCYPGRDDAALDDVSLHVSAGQCLALVGSSGAGKSTLAQLVVGLLEADSGRVMLDGVDLRDLDRRLWRRQVAVVSQQVVLANDTVRNNICYGITDLAPALIDAAIDAAQLRTVINDLPLGLDSKVGENGVQLSGGQRQRLAIARALVRDPALVILDEATSALDGETERAVQTALELLLPGRTSIIIAHRLSTVRHADTIAVMEAGRIVESGTWDQLLAQRGRFYELVELAGGS